MQIKFISSLDTNEPRIMHVISDDIKIIGAKTELNELFESIFNKYQEGLEKNMRGSEFVFDSIDLLYYELHKISINRGGSYIDSPSWIKNKKATINPQNKDNKDNKCFKYAITAALNHSKINNHSEKISKLKPFIDNYNWKDIEFPSCSKDWRKFEQNNKTVALDILYVPYNTKEIRPTYISKYNYKRNNQVILPMITDNNKNWHYLAVKSIPRLFRRITSKLALSCCKKYT